MHKRRFAAVLGIVLCLLVLVTVAVHAQAPREHDEISAQRGNWLCLHFTEAEQALDGFWVLSEQSEMVITIGQEYKYKGIRLSFTALGVEPKPNVPTGFIMLIPALDSDEVVIDYRKSMSWFWRDWAGDYRFTLEGWCEGLYPLPSVVYVRVLPKTEQL